MTNVRLLAAHVINHVTDGQSLADCLEPALNQLADPRDKAFLQAICFGVCRFYSRLDVVLSYLLKKPMNAKDSDVHAVLMVGLYQLMEMRVPEHAAVSETVNATDKLKKSWARGFVNAVLREYLRKREALSEQIAQDEEAQYAHPIWWINAFKKAWPTQWQAILTANNTHPPFSLRVNLKKQSREQYLRHCEELKERRSNPESNDKIIPETLSGIILDPPMPAEELPGFAQGDITVQDGAAQLAAELMDLQPRQHVLDACAAPGGKLTHMLEIEPQLSSVIAIEKEAKRKDDISQNLKRMGFSATLICNDANNVSAWWDGKLFDRILLDAPCSASGVVRRHPDIKLLRQPSDIKVLAKEQLTLLESLWPTLKPNGMLVYATCSVFPQENVEVLKQFLLSHSEAQEKVINAEWGVACEVGRQILPGMHHMDGFYYARLVKHH